MLTSSTGRIGFGMEWREFYLIICDETRVRFNSSNCTQSQLATVVMAMVTTEELDDGRMDEEKDRKWI